VHGVRQAGWEGGGGEGGTAAGAKCLVSQAARLRSRAARPAPSNKFLPKSAIVRRPRTRVLCARVYADTRKRKGKKKKKKMKKRRNQKEKERETREVKRINRGRNSLAESRGEIGRAVRDAPGTRRRIDDQHTLEFRPNLIIP